MAAGEANGRAKLTTEQVVTIRVMRVESDETSRRIAEMFGVCVRTVRRLCSGESWSTAGGPTRKSAPQPRDLPVLDTATVARCGECGCKCNPTHENPRLCLRCLRERKSLMSAPRQDRRQVV